MGSDGTDARPQLPLAPGHRYQATAPCKNRHQHSIQELPFSFRRHRQATSGSPGRPRRGRGGACHHRGAWSWRYGYRGRKTTRAGCVLFAHVLHRTGNAFAFRSLWTSRIPELGSFITDRQSPRQRRPSTGDTSRGGSCWYAARSRFVQHIRVRRGRRVGMHPEDRDALTMTVIQVAHRIPYRERVR